MQHSKFAVENKPFCVLDWDLHEQNLGFINGVDPAYFEYLAQVYVNSPQSETLQSKMRT
jgi:hypothetical protein